MIYEQERRLTELTRGDAVYCDLLAQCEELEAVYHRIAAALPDTEREQLDRYITLCEELEYRRTCLALNMRT